MTTDIYNRIFKGIVWYSPSNGTEFDIFLEQCFTCKRFTKKMLSDSEINTCEILFKILDQQGLKEEDFPEIYQFKTTELDVSGCPAKCLEWKERRRR